MGWVHPVDKLIVPSQVGGGPEAPLFPARMSNIVPALAEVDIAVSNTIKILIELDIANRS